MAKRVRVKGCGYHDILVERSMSEVHVRQHGRPDPATVVVPLQQVPAMIAALQEVKRG